MRRALAAPADHVSLPLHPPSSTAPKPSPSGEGGSPQARRMRGGSVKATTSGKKTDVSTPHQSKIKAFYQFPPGRVKLIPQKRHCLFQAVPLRLSKKCLAEFAAAAANNVKSIFDQGVYLSENTYQAASVEFIRHGRTNYARSRLLKPVEKPRGGFSGDFRQPERHCLCQAVPLFIYFTLEVERRVTS